MRRKFIKMACATAGVVVGTAAYYSRRGALTAHFARIVSQLEKIHHTYRVAAALIIKYAGPSAADELTNLRPHLKPAPSPEDRWDLEIHTNPSDPTTLTVFFTGDLELLRELRHRIADSSGLPVRSVKYLRHDEVPDALRIDLDVALPRAD